MTWHAFTHYLRYLRKAKGRHGVHSPFVYSFVEKVLRGKTGTLTGRMNDFLAKRGFHMIAAAVPEAIAGLPKNIHTVIVLPGIHTDAAHTAAWEALAAAPDVTLSIDLYHTGLLLYHPDFKIKQHFVLK